MCKLFTYNILYVTNYFYVFVKKNGLKWEKVESKRNFDMSTERKE